MFELPFLLAQHAMHAQYWNLTVICQSISFLGNSFATVRFVYLPLWHKSPALTIVITEEGARKEPVWASKHHTFWIHSAHISWSLEVTWCVGPEGCVCKWVSEKVEYVITVIYELAAPELSYSSMNGILSQKMSLIQFSTRSLSNVKVFVSMGDREEGTSQTGGFGYHSSQEKHERKKSFYRHSQERGAKTQAFKFPEDIAYLTTAVEYF